MLNLRISCNDPLRTFELCGPADTTISFDPIAIIPGIPEVPGAVDPENEALSDAPRIVLWCKASDGS
jgi:hypothetical protein